MYRHIGMKIIVMKGGGRQQWLEGSWKACVKVLIDVLIRGEGSMCKVNFG